MPKKTTNIDQPIVNEAKRTSCVLWHSYGPKLLLVVMIHFLSDEDADDLFNLRLES